MYDNKIAVFLMCVGLAIVLVTLLKWFGQPAEDAPYMRFKLPLPPNPANNPGDTECCDEEGRSAPHVPRKPR